MNSRDECTALLILLAAARDREAKSAFSGRCRRAERRIVPIERSRIPRPSHPRRRFGSG
ncbi:MAG: hypothetical protein JW751_20065 [Polyangiaceae bacterium]|nr:hypothetical protein [Polyangiaceae bacterium]